MSARSLLYPTVVAGLLAMGSTALADQHKPENQTPDVSKLSGVRTGYVPAGPDDYAAEGGTPISKILFVNRCVGGCTLRPGANDARANTVQPSIVSSEGTLSEFAHGDQVWNDMVDCLKEIYAPFDVQIVEEDPGQTFHHEAIVAGRAAEIGYDSNALGVAPISSSCDPFNNVISLSFANAAGGDAQFICEIVAQESAHAFGLDHGLDCSDPMTYLSPCGPKYFRDRVTKCGEFSERACFCGGTAQNSHKKLLSVFGEGTSTIAAPVVELLLPSGDTVDDQFQVRATATDNRGIKRVEVWFNGTKFIDIEGNEWPSSSPYIYTAPANLADGVIDIEIKAYNDLEIVSTAIRTVTKGSPCTDASQCSEGQLCDGGGRCFWEPPTGNLGDACETDRDCISGLCPDNGGEKLCSEICIPGIADQCDADYDCLQVGVGQGVCWPAEGGGGGCCSVGDSNGPGGELLLYGMAVLLLGFRRRRGASA